MDRLFEIVLGNAGSAALLALAVALASRWLRRPAILHLLWVLVLVRLLVPPVVELAVLPAADAEAVGTTWSMEAASVIPLGELPAQQSLDRSVPELLLLLWALGLVAVAALALVRMHRLRRKLQTARDADYLLHERLQRVCRRMGIKRPPAVKLVDGGVPPMLLGTLGSPSLILPEPLFAGLSESEQEALIAHEIAHLKRRDHWVRHLEMVTALLFWWHPVVWWARRRLRAAEELCCDALVASRLPEHNRAYADCLVKTVRYLAAQRPLVAAGSAMANLHELKGRITMIMSRSLPVKQSRKTQVALLLLAAALLLISPTLAARHGGGPAFTGEPISLELAEARLGDVINSFSQITGLTMAVHPEAETLGLLDNAVTFTFDQTPWDQAFDTMLEANGLGWTREGDIIWVHPQWNALDGDRNFTGDPITLNLEDADIRDVLSTFSQLTHIEIVVDPSIEASVTVSFDNVPWDQALDAIVRINGLELVVEDGTIYVNKSASTAGKFLSPGRHAKGSHNSQKGIGRLDRTERVVGDHRGEKVFRYVVDGDITEPKRIDGPNPVYPDEAKKEKVQGVVVLETIITAEGEVADIDVLRGAPYGLTSAAVEAVRNWTFEPATLDGEAVAVSFILTVRFALQ